MPLFSCGNSISAIITNTDFIERCILTCGDNSQGQLGHGKYSSYSNTLQPVVGLSRIQSVSCGYDHMLALNDDGEVYAWGSNTQGQLGTNDIDNRNSPVKVDIVPITYICTGMSKSEAIDIDGNVWVWGSKYVNTLGKLYDLSIARIN